MGGQDEMNTGEPGGAPQPASPPTGQPQGHGWLARLQRMGRVRLAVIAALATALVVGLTVASAVGAAGGHGAGHDGPPAQAENFTLGTLGHPGRKISLSVLAGRPVILNFFASWCAPCQRETPLIARFSHGQHGRVAFVGIDVNDSSTAALAFARKAGITYPVAADPALTTANAYRLPGLPATFFLDARHRILKRVYGPVTLAELTTGAALISQRAK